MSALQATVILVDNSDWMRNADYSPNRFRSELEVLNVVFTTKTQQHPENTLAVMTASKPRVLTTFTNQLGPFLSGIHHMDLHGENELLDALLVAQLALKNRTNKNQSQYILAFVGSPLKDTKEELIKMAKKLKKNSIAIDIVSFGEIDVNKERLEAFIGTVNNNENSHLVVVEPTHNLSDKLIQTPIFANTPMQQFEFGVDPDLDPELAMALKMSMDEEKNRQGGKPGGQEDVIMEEMDPELAKAIQMSMQDSNMSTDEELQRALEMSMKNDTEMKDAEKKKDKK